MKWLKKIALMQLGKPYLWAHQNPLLGFDCSGLMIFLLRTAMIIDGREDYSAQSLYRFLKRQNCTSEKSLGSLAFYGLSLDTIRHVAFCIDDKWCVEAHGDKSCKTISDAMCWNDNQGAYVRLSLINRRQDLLCCIRPVYNKLGG